MIKTILAATALAAAALGMSASARPLDIHTETVIAAPASAVWAILADTAAYPDWNPYHVRIEGPLAEGRRIALTIHKPDGSVVDIRPRVRRIAPGRALVWGGGIPGLFRGEHVFELEPLGPGCTRVIQRERFDGVFMPYASLDGIDTGYAMVNAALKRRAEARAPGRCR